MPEARGDFREKYSGLSDEEKRGLEGFAAGQQSGSSSEERRLMGEINKAVSMERKAPVIEKLGSMFKMQGDAEQPEKKKKLSEYAYVLQLKILKLHCCIGSYYYAAALFIFVFALLFARDVYYYRAVKFFSVGGFVISRCVLFFLSAGAVLFYLTLRKNLWQECGGGILMPVVALLAGSSAALRMYDSNFPVYSRLMGSFTLPGLSLALIALGV
ncbi:MAG: hypothetical protein U9O97_02320 [Elusimicrobiota bacterium]|nr:hypothetical protein [Elusimicrobiota bacterium]